MRHAIEAAPSDGKIVIIEDDKTGSSGIVHRREVTRSGV